MIHPIKVKDGVIKKELPILIVVTASFSIAILFHLIGFSNSKYFLNRQDGLLFLSLFIVFILYIISVIRAKKGIFEEGKPKYNIKLSILITIVCCILIIFSSDLVVENAKILAEQLNVSTKIITMTIVVIGTSLPEMTMTVVAAKKEEVDIALGNIIGTNIFNIGVVLGLPLLIYGGIESTNFSIIDVMIVYIAAFIFYLFARSDKVLSRREGIIMVILFIVYYAYVFVS